MAVIVDMKKGTPFLGGRKGIFRVEVAHKSSG